MPDATFADPRLARLYDPFDPDRSDLDLYVAIAEEWGSGSDRWPHDVRRRRGSGQRGSSDGYGCLLVGGFWLGMGVLLWVPPLFAIAWAVIGVVLVARPAAVGRRLTSGSTASTRSVVVRALTTPWRTPLVVRGFGLVVLAIVAVGVLADTGVILTE